MTLNGREIEELQLDRHLEPCFGTFVDGGELDGDDLAAICNEDWFEEFRDAEIEARAEIGAGL